MNAIAWVGLFVIVLGSGFAWHVMTPTDREIARAVIGRAVSEFCGLVDRAFIALRQRYEDWQASRKGKP
jgi:hypothetical protein